MTRKVLGLVCSLALGVGVAACGSSTAPGVQLAPSAGQTAASVTVTPTTPTTTTTATVTPTPKTGPLSKEPVLNIPKGPAPTHLVKIDLIKGTGPVAGPTSTVTVNYVGALYNGGKEFDSSWKRNQPFTTALSAGSVIDGWVKGVAGMKVGGRRELIIPPSLGYGKSGSPPTIPANATLVFVVDLLAVS